MCRGEGGVSNIPKPNMLSDLKELRKRGGFGNL